MTTKHFLFSLALASSALSLQISQSVAGEIIGLEGAYGDEVGCDFYKNGDIRTDGGIYIDREQIWYYEGGCSFINVKNIKDMAGGRDGWSVKLICASEGIAYSYDAIIRYDVTYNGTEKVDIIPESGSADDRRTELHPCK